MGGDAKAQEKKEKEERINIESRSYRKSDLLDEKLRINDRKRIYIRQERQTRKQVIYRKSIEVTDRQWVARKKCQIGKRWKMINQKLTKRRQTENDRQKFDTKQIEKLDIEQIGNKEKTKKLQEIGRRIGNNTKYREK